MFIMAASVGFAADSTSGQPPTGLPIVAYQLSPTGTPTPAITPTSSGGAAYCSGNSATNFFYGLGIKGNVNLWECNSLNAGFR